jgi:hypothetical protein
MPNINIFIEIENSFYSYLNTYQILDIFKEKSINNLDNIELIREVKIISTILHNFESNELLKRNINLDKNYLIKKKIHKKIILKYFEIKNPNYYQINAFINVLSCKF